MSLEQFARFLSRHFGPPRLALAVAAWILALGVWGTFARDVFPMEHRLEWEIPLELRAPLFAKFDAGWYLSIIDWGYGPPPPEGKPSAHAFFPLYPWTAKVLHRTFAMDGFHAGMLVAYLALFRAMPLFFREAIDRHGGDAAAWRSVVFLLLFPTAFFLASMYAESTFLLFSLLAIRDARAGKTKTAVLWGILLGLTKASAMCVAPALFFVGLGSRQNGLRVRHALLSAAAPLVTVWAWIFGMGAVKGEPGLYFRSLAGWHRGSSPLSGTLFWFQRAVQYFGRGEWHDDPMRLLDYAAVILFLFLIARFTMRRKWAEASWTAAALALPISTGLPYGIPRYVLSVYPAFYELDAVFAARPLGRKIWWAASGALLLFAAARFVNALGVA